MFKIKIFNLKRPIIQIILIHICFALLLGGCISTSCSMQAVAGGSPYCEEVSAGQ